MKLICIYANYAAYNNNALRPLYNKDAPIVYAMADTALLTGGKPFFVPDCAAPCTCGAQLAVRISRLGRFISPRFARRYYDAFESWPGDGGGAMTRLVAEYIEEELAKLLRFAAQ